jgi:hypothetical protein
MEIPHPNPSPWGRGAKTLILSLLPLAQFGRGGWGVRAIELTLFNRWFFNGSISLWNDRLGIGATTGGLSLPGG